MQYKAVMALGGPTEVIEKYIEAHAGDAIKTKIAKQCILDNIEKEHAQVKDFDVLLKVYEEKIVEELRQKKEKMANKDSSEKKRLSKEEWIQKWKPEYLERLNRDGDLPEVYYRGAFLELGLKTKEEVEVWARS